MSADDVQRFPVPVFSHDLAGGGSAVFDFVLDEAVGTPVAEVPSGTVLRVELRSLHADGGALVHLSVAAEAQAQCVRCLDDMLIPVSVDTDLLACYGDARRDLIAEGDEEAEDFPVLSDAGELDLFPILRDLFTEQLPFKPLCSPDCAGLCPDCGVRLADVEPNHHHDHFDPRFAELADFFDTDVSGDTHE